LRPSFNYLHANIYIYIYIHIYVHICLCIYKHAYLYDKKVDSDWPLDKVSPLANVAQNEECCPKFSIFIYMCKEFLAYLRHDTF